MQVAKGGVGSMLVDGFRRYELSWVQRRVAGQAGLPRSYLQADLDLILPPGRTPTEQLLGEAEVRTCQPANGHSAFLYSSKGL